MFYAFRLAHDPFAEAAFTSPLNLYLIALPLALYRGMFEVFGLGVDLPYRLVSTALVLACGVLFYTLARRRIGDLAAILPTALLVLFGAAGEVVASAIRIPMLIAIAAGLGALLALERRDLRGDLLAATLLLASVLSHPVALGFLLAAAVVLWFRPPSERWTRAWIVLVPGAVFAVWWAFVRTPAPGVESRVSFGDVLHFGWDSWVSVTSAASGLSGVLPEPSFQQPAAKVLAVLVLALLAAGTIRHARRLPSIYWAALAALVALLVAPRLGPNGWVRVPEGSLPVSGFIPSAPGRSRAGRHGPAGTGMAPRCGWRRRLGRRLQRGTADRLRAVRAVVLGASGGRVQRLRAGGGPRGQGLPCLCPSSHRPASTSRPRRPSAPRRIPRPSSRPPHPPSARPQTPHS